VWKVIQNTECNSMLRHNVIILLSLSYGRRSVDQFVLVSGSPLGPMIRFYPYPFFSENCFVVLPVGRPLWREYGSVTYSAIADWSGHWGPISIHYRLIRDCFPSSSTLTTRRDYVRGIITSLHERNDTVISDVERVRLSTRNPAVCCVYCLTFQETN
jgi:hypothetical protein